MGFRSSLRGGRLRGEFRSRLRGGSNRWGIQERWSSLVVVVGPSLLLVSEEESGSVHHTMLDAA